MGCGGSKAIKTTPAPVPVQIQPPAHAETSPTQQRQRPEGKITEETPAADGRPETEEEEETTEEEEELEGPITQEQITFVQETWKLVNGDLEQVGVEFYIR